MGKFNQKIKSLFTGSIRRNLYFLVCLSIIPALCIILFSGMLRKDNAIQTAQESAKNFVRTVSSQQKMVTENTKMLLMTLAQLPELFKHDSTESNELLKELLLHYPIYTNLFIADQRGRILNSGQPIANTNMYISGYRYFREVMRTRDYSVGDYVSADDSNKQLFHFSYPILDERGRVLSVVVAAASLEMYDRFFADMELAPNTIIYLADRNGRVVFTYPANSSINAGDMLPVSYWQQLEEMREDQGIFRVVDSGGQAHIVAYERLRLSSSEWPYLHIVLSTPESEVYAEAKKSMYLSLALLALATLLALGTAALTTGLTIMPAIRKLRDTAHELTMGNFSARTNILHDKGELGAVATALDEMAEAVQLRTHELMEEKVKAEAASQAKSEFLANMSHEIRTPLNGVLGMLQIIELGELTSDQRESLQTAIYSGRNLLRIINDILDFSKIEAGKLDIEDRSFDLAGSCRAIYDIFSPDAKTKGLELVLDMDKNLPEYVRGDEVRVRQIMFNLVGNAMKFTSHGQVALKVSHMKQDNERCWVKFVVSDTGIGIAKDKQAAVFESFTQADGATTRKFGGSGLGLTIVRRLIALMNGRIEMASEEGKGTQITFILPFLIAGKPQAEESAQNESKAEAPQGLTLLLAEDEPVNHITSTRFLEYLGHKVVHAVNGREVLEKLLEQPVDGILMDIQMPEMDGMEATKIIRHDAKYADYARLPIIALTAHALSGDKERFLEAGMDDYLSKPLNRAELAVTLSRVFGRPK